MDKNILVTDIKNFWDKIKIQWDQLYSLFKIDPINVLYNINNMLSESLQSLIEIDATMNEINRQKLDIYNKYIELYISPKINQNNIPIMQLIYQFKPDLPYLTVACYKPYHPSDDIIDKLDFNDFQVSYKDFGFQSSYGYRDGKPVLNLIIVIKKSIADYIIKKHQISFKRNKTHENGQILSISGSNTPVREAWLPTENNTIIIYLLNIIGEYHLLNHIGYIELLPEDDPLIQKDSKFLELVDIKKQLQVILPHWQHKYCQYCQHCDLQVKLYKCARCQIRYCSRICQQAHWKIHKQLCKNNFK